MGELIHCPGCGEITSESIPRSECITCASGHRADIRPSRQRSSSVPRSAERQRYTIVVMIIPQTGPQLSPGRMEGGNEQ